MEETFTRGVEDLKVSWVSPKLFRSRPRPSTSKLSTVKEWLTLKLERFSLLQFQRKESFTVGEKLKWGNWGWVSREKSKFQLRLELKTQVQDRSIELNK
jgi:hypothetical protein